MSKLFVAPIAIAWVTLLAACDWPRSASDTAATTVARASELADLERRAEEGDAESQDTLGHLYHVGEGVPRDPAKAVEWWQKAAMRGHVQAQSALGYAYFHGEGVPRDTTRAVEWWQKAAVRGDVQAQGALGYAYFHGEGVPRDGAKAVEWWQKAARQGDGQAQSYLGYAFFHGEGVPKDDAKAVEWWQKAGRQGDSLAEFFLGGAYQRGIGAPNEFSKSADSYQKSAAQGYADAQRFLAAAYFRGEGVAKDAAKAVEWWQKAAAQGDGAAQRALGLIFAYGESDVPADEVLAYAWNDLAAGNGIKTAAEGREGLERFLSTADLAEAKRLSSGWKPGRILMREVGVSGSGTSTRAFVIPTRLSTGTLFVVSAGGRAITTHHVVDGCRELHVPGREGLASVITEDLVNDLALIQIPGSITAAATIAAEPGKVHQGDDVVVFGFPISFSIAGNLTPGTLSDLMGLGNNTSQIQITAPIQAGSSGSPAMNMRGEVVGVVSMTYSDTVLARATNSLRQDVNYAVSGQTLKTFLDVHGVAYRDGAGFFSGDKSHADLADDARKWTYLVECWR